MNEQDFYKFFGYDVSLEDYVEANKNNIYGALLSDLTGLYGPEMDTDYIKGVAIELATYIKFNTNNGRRVSDLDRMFNLSVREALEGFSDEERMNVTELLSVLAVENVKIIAEELFGLALIDAGRVSVPDKVKKLVANGSVDLDLIAIGLGREYIDGLITAAKERAAEKL